MMQPNRRTSFAGFESRRASAAGADSRRTSIAGPGPNGGRVSSGTEGADIVIECSGGQRVQAHSQLLLLASPHFRRALGSHAIASTPVSLGSVQVEGSKEAWTYILDWLQPIYPRPLLTINMARLMLPVAVQYDIRSVVAEVNAYLADQLPAQLSADPKSNGYVIKWLRLAEELNLASLRKLCLAKVRDLVIHKQLRPALLVPQPQSKEGRCHKCGLPPEQVQATEEPQLLDVVKSLDRQTLEDLLASMVLASKDIGLATVKSPAPRAPAAKS